jgi:hypothetical protein
MAFTVSDRINIKVDLNNIISKCILIVVCRTFQLTSAEIEQYIYKYMQYIYK